MAARTTTGRIRYTPSQIETMSEKTVRREASRLRSIVQKRQKRLIAKGSTGEIATRPLPKISFLTGEDVRAELADLSRILRDPRSTITGEQHYQQAVRAKLTEHSYSNIAQGDLKRFGDYMDDMRDRYIDRIYGSAIAAIVYDAAAKVGVSGKTLMRNFREYLEDADKMEHLRKTLEKKAKLPAGRKRLSSNELRELL